MNVSRLASDQYPVVVKHHPVNDGELNPKHSIKRFIFVTSLWCWMNHIDKPTACAMEELNERFKLVMRSKALLFPAAMSKMVWGKIDLATIHTRYKQRKIRIEDAVTELMRCAPSWVRYDSDELLLRDVEAIFRSVKTV